MNVIIIHVNFYLLKNFYDTATYDECCFLEIHIFVKWIYILCEEIIFS